jgi:hypothetical protein
MDGGLRALPVPPRSGARFVSFGGSWNLSPRTVCHPATRHPPLVTFGGLIWFDFVGFAGFFELAPNASEGPDGPQDISPGRESGVTTFQKTIGAPKGAIDPQR